MKRKILILFTAVLLIALLAAGSYAYVAKTASVTNKITTGGVSIEVYTKGGDGNDLPDDGLVILPGDTVEETVTVKNTSNHPAWIRVSVTPCVIDKPELDAEECMVLQGLNTTDWTKQGDYYYYNEVLAAGETTSSLFTAVHFDGDKIDNSYLGESFGLEVKGDGVQSENNGSTALTAEGWPA